MIDESFHAVLFHGPPNAGKRVEAERRIAALLRLKEYAAVHPDLVVLDLEEGKKQISVEQVRAARARLFLRPAFAPRVVAYLPHADRLNESGMNALLKILEEPPAGAAFVLVAEDVGRFPATFLSRVVRVPFHAGRSRADRPAWLDDVFSATTLGARLRIIDDLSKRCESADDPSRAWREAISTPLSPSWFPEGESGAQGVLFGIALVTALHFVGSPVSPRVALEAGAIRMSGDVFHEARNLMPTHAPRTLPLLFDPLVY